MNEHRDSPCSTLTELQTTIRNGRWVLGVAGGVLGMGFMFLGWVANDNLAGIRSDIKEAKGMLQSGQVDMARMRLEVDYLKQWKQELDAKTVAKR